MTPRQIELQRQRGRLQERIAQQRLALADQLKPALEAERLAQRGLQAGQQGLNYLKTQPWAAALLVAAVALLRPRRIWRGLRWGIWIWRRYRSLRQMVPAALWSALAGQRASTRPPVSPP